MSDAPTNFIARCDEVYSINIRKESADPLHGQKAKSDLDVIFTPYPERRRRREQLLLYGADDCTSDSGNRIKWLRRRESERHSGTSRSQTEPEPPACAPAAGDSDAS